ncbi:MAG: sulfotransferase domain-containing protein [Symploca sp. SIO2E6]|nr:sulfotransferase domain-containing protein [Symploca sp. SIO2E6]
MQLPTFLIIGIQKAGTTSIYEYLRQHPQVYMSPVKETNFLEKDWSKIPPDPRKKNRIDTFEKYSQLFQAVTDELAIGEASPNYLFHYQSSVQLIQHYLPQAKMIAILRNPAERAYSDYLMHIREGINEDISLSEQITLRSNSSFTLRKGFYYTPIKHYYETFGREQIKIYLYEDLCKNPVALMQDMYQFIGVDDRFCPDTAKKYQVAQVPKVKLVNTLLRKQNLPRTIVASLMRYLLPLTLRQSIRSRLIKLNSTDKKQAPLSPEDRQQLVALYREDILQLQDLIQRDLSSWLS